MTRRHAGRSGPPDKAGRTPVRTPTGGTLLRRQARQSDRTHGGARDDLRPRTVCLRGQLVHYGARWERVHCAPPWQTGLTARFSAQPLFSGGGVDGVQLNTEIPTPEVAGRDKGGAGTSEGVQDQVAMTGVGVDERLERIH